MPTYGNRPRPGDRLRRGRPARRSTLDPSFPTITGRDPVPGRGNRPGGGIPSNFPSNSPTRESNGLASWVKSPGVEALQRGMRAFRSSVTDWGRQIADRLGDTQYEEADYGLPAIEQRDIPLTPNDGGYAAVVDLGVLPRLPQGANFWWINATAFLKLDNPGQGVVVVDLVPTGVIWMGVMSISAPTGVGSAAVRGPSGYHTLPMRLTVRADQPGEATIYFILEPGFAIL